MSTEEKTPLDERSVVSVRAMEIGVAIALLLFGLLIAGTSYKLGARWGDDGPQAGYFPFYIGCIILLSSLITLVQALLNRASGASTFVGRRQLKQVLSVLLPALVFALMIQWFGIYLAAIVYMTVFMVWLGKYVWWKSLILGVAVSVSVFLMFEIWFQVPLHKGTLFNPLELFGY